MKLPPIHHCLIILAIITLSSCCRQNTQDDSSLAFEPAKIKSFGQQIKLDNSARNEAITAILGRYGLSSTGNIYFLGNFKVARKIKSFCEEYDEVCEYRMAHLFTTLINVIWYNPKTKQTYVLY
ncbi:MAG: hypothetical protein ACYSSI_07320 [Planctomycetota bacterium]|jgi:hypothetical protein